MVYSGDFGLNGYTEFSEYIQICEYEKSRSFFDL